MGETIRERVKKARPRVVVTGLGAVTPLGNTVRETWEGLVNGRSGIDTITLFDASDLPTRIAGEIKGFDPKKYLSFKEARRMSRASQVAVASATQAIEDAGFSAGWPDEERVSVLYGTGVGGLEKIEQELRTLCRACALPWSDERSRRATLDGTRRGLLLCRGSSGRGRSF